MKIILEHAVEVERFDLLDHIKNLLVLVQPDVVIRDCHFWREYITISLCGRLECWERECFTLKGDLLGILEERVWPPHSLQPVKWQ